MLEIILSVIAGVFILLVIWLMVHPDAAKVVEQVVNFFRGDGK